MTVARKQVAQSRGSSVIGAEILGVANLTRGTASAEGTNTVLEFGNANVHRAPTFAGATMRANRP